MYDEHTRREALALVRSHTLSLNAVSKQLGISRATLRGWDANDGAYAPGIGTAHSCPRCHEMPTPDDAAYAHLLGLYLGDGCLSALPKGVYSLRVACDAKYPRLIDECVATMEIVGPRRVYRVRAPGCIQVTSLWKHWPCLFPQHGPGRKHERPIVLERWQEEVVERHPGPFLRGLFHSDGCRATNKVSRPVAGTRRRYEYPRWFFSNESEDILRLCEDALDRLGVPHRRNRPNSLSVARRAGVALLDEVVGPKA